MYGNADVQTRSGAFVRPHCHSNPFEGFILLDFVTSCGLAGCSTSSEKEPRILFRSSEYHSRNLYTLSLSSVAFFHGLVRIGLWQIASIFSAAPLPKKNRVRTHTHTLSLSLSHPHTHAHRLHRSFRLRLSRKRTKLPQPKKRRRSAS